jgi:hypothetical protein
MSLLQASNNVHVLPAVLRSSPVCCKLVRDQFHSLSANPDAAKNSPGCKPEGSAPAGVGSSGTDSERGGSSFTACFPSLIHDPLLRPPPLVVEPHHRPAPVSRLVTMSPLAGTTPRHGTPPSPLRNDLKVRGGGLQCASLRGKASDYCFHYKQVQGHYPGSELAVPQGEIGCQRFRSGWFYGNP